MDKITSIRVLLGQLTQGKWLLELLEDYEEPTFENGFETEDDMDDLIILIATHMDAITNKKVLIGTPLYGAEKIWEFVKAAEFICSPPDIDDIDSILAFRRLYPNFYHTMKIWSWG